MSALVVLGVALAVAPAAARAQAPAGHLAFSGLADAYDVGTRGVQLAFAPFVSGTGNTGVFASFNAEPGTLRTLLVGSGTRAMGSFLKIGGYTFRLKRLPASGYGQDQCYVLPEIGQQCTPLQYPRPDEVPTSPNFRESPFALVNYASGIPDFPISSTASFRLVGTVVAPGGGLGVFTGTISTDFVGASFQEALGTLEYLSNTGGSGLPGLEYRAEFDVQPGVALTAAPEPTTVATLGVGLLGLLGAARARRRRAA